MKFHKAAQWRPKILQLCAIISKDNYAHNIEQLERALKEISTQFIKEKL